MKCVLLTGGIILLFASSVFATPIVTCDPYTADAVQPNYFILYVDGTTNPIQIGVAKDAGGLNYMYYDLASLLLPLGDHTVAAAAGNSSGVSSMTSFVPFTLIDARKPTPPVGVRITK